MIVALSRFTIRCNDEQSYRQWHSEHACHEAHKSIPKELKLVPGSAEVRLLEIFTD